MFPIDCPVPLEHRRRKDRVPRLHLVLVVAMAAVVALVAARPLPLPTQMLAPEIVDSPRPAGDAGPVDYLPARLPAPTSPAAPWIDTF